MALHDLPLDGLGPEDFTHLTYRRWFSSIRRLRQKKFYVGVDLIRADLAEQGHESSKIDLRALKRLLRMAPPRRIRNNVRLLCGALSDRRRGKTVNLHRLIN